MSMWLGITFLALALIAVPLQAWLWSFPMVPDPGGPDPHGKSTAPRLWTQVHRVLGFVYVVIYVVLMVEMVPRLWEYQFELPARTVVHACMGIVIGCLLIAKIGIIRWFQHFGKALPGIGFGLLVCTIILATLSIPFAIRAHDFGEALEPENLARVKRVLSSVDFEEEIDVEQLASESGFARGRQILTSKCVACHDLRTILVKPRTGTQWYKLCKRMAGKPTLGQRIQADEVPAVTAYLVAITPSLTEDLERRKDAERAVAARKEQVKHVDTKEQPKLDLAKAKEVYRETCSQCHELEEVDGYVKKKGEQDAAGWKKILERMVEEGAEFDEAEARLIVAYLAATQGRTAE